MDFTFKAFQDLMNALLSGGYNFLTVSEYTNGEFRKDQLLILARFDVEERYENALQLAQIQSEAGIRGTYYFRLFHGMGDVSVIQQVAAMGHEIGYHYDDLSHCKGNIQQAIDRFSDNLAWLRKFSRVTSITMEGAPLSRWDNRDLWIDISYRDLGITCEPYFDLDFDQLFYLTDTGRQWDGWKYSRRDKLAQQQRWIEMGWTYHGSDDIIGAIGEGSFPKQLMMTFHPQRWNSDTYRWAVELIGQEIKNQVKRLIF